MSDVARLFLRQNSLLDLALFGLAQPPLDLIDPLLVGPRLELGLAQVEYFPALQLHNLLRQPLHLGNLAVWLRVLLKVEHNGNFLRVEHIMEVEQIVDGHEGSRVHVAVAGQEAPESHVLLLLMVLVLEFDCVEVLFSVEKLILVLAQERAEVTLVHVPLLKMLFKVEVAGFEWFVVNQRQHVRILTCGLNYLSPDLLICVVSEHQVVDEVVKARVVKLFDVGSDLLKHRAVKVWISSPPDCVGKHNVAQVSD